MQMKMALYARMDFMRSPERCIILSALYVAEQIFQYLPVHHPQEIGSRLHTETFIRLPVECIPAIPLIPIFRISDIQIKNRFIHPFGSSDQSLTEITATSQDDMLSDKRNLSVIIYKRGLEKKFVSCLLCLLLSRGSVHSSN